ncbi:MAG: SDR family oxidoreductase [Spirochaetia bacterium]|nr:SDR family oxidoreductase [Spirochaetia bacterium]
MDIKGKTVLVTGSAGGLGRAIIEGFLAKGARCIVSDVREEELQKTTSELASQGEVIGIAADVRKEESVAALIEKGRQKFGNIDVAVLNAGILRDGFLIKADSEGNVRSRMSLEQWQAVIDVNLTGVFLSGREAAAAMAEQRTGGVIIPIASVAMHGNPGQTNYSAAKAGVAAMTKLWAVELARYKIRVAGIAPGFIATDMVLRTMNQKALEIWKEKIPIGRLGLPQEIASTAAFIVENDLITGVVIEATGGVKI